MHPDIVLLCLTTDAPLMIKHIFEDNLNWAAFCLAEKDNLRAVELNEVNKMLSCKDERRGFFTYECVHCGITKAVYFGCNSCIYTNCGKNHTDKWAKNLQNALSPPACSVHNPGYSVANCEEKTFSTEGFDGRGNRSNQRHHFAQALIQHIPDRQFKMIRYTVRPAVEPKENIRAIRREV